MLNAATAAVVPQEAPARGVVATATTACLLQPGDVAVAAPHSRNKVAGCTRHKSLVERTVCVAAKAPCVAAVLVAAADTCRHHHEVQKTLMGTSGAPRGPGCMQPQTDTGVLCILNA